MWTLIEQIFPYAIMFTVPLLITALGGLFSERSGVTNIGLDGLMIFGAFASAFSITKLQPIMDNNMLAIWLGILIAMVVGVLVSLLHAFAAINLNADQVISGTAINLMASAITIYLARQITGSGNIKIPEAFTPGDVKIFNVNLSNIPIIGDLFFTKSYPTTWLVLAIVLFSAFVLSKTAFGLRLKACGENPHAAEAAGVSVRKMRYIGVMLSGAFAGLGGAVIIVTYSGQFTGNVSGLGFLALAALIFGQWRPFGVLGATFFFGFATTIANVSQVVPQFQVIPPVFLKIFPYVVTIIALIIFSKSSRAPKAVGEPYDPSGR